MTHCPHCQSLKFKKFGHFYHQLRRSFVQRYRCHQCRRSFSSRTLAHDKYQKKSHLNELIAVSLCECASLRSLSRSLKLSYTTVYKKFLWIAKLNEEPQELPLSGNLYFDEMESIEHTKLKPVTIALAVDDDYKIHGLKVGRIPAKGHLAKNSVKKYGPRQNQSYQCCYDVLKAVSQKESPEWIVTDKKPSYSTIVKQLFKNSTHIRCSRKVDEMPFLLNNKRVRNPLFPINQRCASLRSGIKRLVRRSWCTTKKLENLQKHLDIYRAFNNGTLIC